MCSMRVRSGFFLGDWVCVFCRLGSLLWVLGRVDHENVYLNFRGPLCSNGWVHFDVCWIISKLLEKANKM